VNPYLSTAIAMCIIGIIAIVLTAYLAAHMNRKAKADLSARLQPLADKIDGELQAEEVTVTGRWHGHIAEGRMANALDGPGRVFFTRIMDPAGGEKWVWTSSSPRKPDEPREIKFECKASPELCSIFESELPTYFKDLLKMPGWTRVEYDPEAGHIRLTKPMLTRNDIPSPELFERQLDALVTIADYNRAHVQVANPEPSPDPRPGESA
jgi:hypothetical protein